MKKILWTFGALGTAGVVLAPIASVVACDDNKFSSVTIKESAKDDETILNEMVTATYGSSILTGGTSPQPIVKDIIESFKTSGYNYAMDPAKWDTPEKQEAMKKAREGVEKIWNTPQGESIRLAYITTMMGNIMWGLPFTKASNAVIDGILAGIYSAGFSPTEKLNTFKVKLINNIRAALEATDAKRSLKKFAGFVEWMTSADNNYANLKTTLMGGEINSDFMYGVQTTLNFNDKSNKFIEAFTMENPTNLKVSSLTPNQTQWIKDIQNSLEMKDVKADQREAIVKLFADTEQSRIDFANLLISELPGPGVIWRTKIITASIGSVWNIPGDVAVASLESAVFGVAASAVSIKNHIADVERTHLATLDEFIGFTDSIKSSTNQYAFLKNLLKGAGATDDEIKKIQVRFNDGADKTGANTLTPLVPSSATKVDIYA